MLEAQFASLHWKHTRLGSMFTRLEAGKTRIVEQNEAKINI